MIHVDDMRMPARVGHLDAVWSHLLSSLPGPSGTAELLAFAARMGLEARWLQNPGRHTEHFDLPEPRRIQALELGAVPIAYGREVAELLRCRARGERFDLAAWRALRPAPGPAG
jgi:hypothetical protein